MKRMFIVFLLAAPAAAQLPRCTDLVIIDPAAAPIRSGTATRASITDAGRAEVVKLPTAPTGGNWQAQAADVNEVKNYFATHAVAAMRPTLRFQFFDAANAAVDNPRPFTIAGEQQDSVCTATQPPPGGVETGGLLTQDPCFAKGSAEEERLRRLYSTSQQPFTLLVFGVDTQEPCYWNRDYGVAGDPIHISLLTDTTLVGRPQVEFTPCSLEPAAPALFVPATFPSISPEQAAEERPLLNLPPRRCFNSSVTVTIAGRSSTIDPVTRTVTQRAFSASYPLRQYDRYRGGLQVGVLFTQLHDVAYGLRTDGSINRIFSKGPIHQGPEYTASVVLYSLVRNIAELFGGRRFYGRDIVNDQGIDRLGGIIGVGLNHPGDRFFAGVSLELFRGVNIVGAYEYARITTLSGYNENDPFTGSEASIPTAKRWDHDVVAGISLDTRYITALFSHE